MTKNMSSMPRPVYNVV